jgi:hypothetical protein
MISIARQINMVDPDLGSRLYSDSIACFGEDFGNFDVSDNDVGYINDTQAYSLKSYDKEKEVKHGDASNKISNSQEPAAPRTDVFDPISTTVFPVIVPLIITTLGSSPLTAAVSSSKEVTRVTFPPDPPLVL